MTKIVLLKLGVMPHFLDKNSPAAKKTEEIKSQTIAGTERKKLIIKIDGGRYRT